MPFILTFLVFAILQAFRPNLDLQFKDAKTNQMNYFDTRTAVITVLNLMDPFTLEVQPLSGEIFLFDWDLTSRNLATMDKLHAFSKNIDPQVMELTFTGAHGGVQENTDYCVIVFVAVDEGYSWDDLESMPEKIGYSSFCFETNAPPQGGICELSRATIGQGQTFRIICTGWTAKHLPLIYRAYFFPDCADFSNINACELVGELGTFSSSGESNRAQLATQISYMGHHVIRVIISDDFGLTTKQVLTIRVTHNAGIDDPPQLTREPLIDYEQPEELLEFSYCTTRPWSGDSLLTVNPRYGSPKIDYSGPYFPDIIGHEECARLCDSMHGCAYFSAAALSSASQSSTQRCYVYRTCTSPASGNFFIYRLVTQRPTTADPTYFPTEVPSVSPSGSPIIDPTKAPTLECKDHENWHDAAGSAFTCEWYAENDRCEHYGHDIRYENMGLTASRACCICGREITEFTTTDYPTKWRNTSAPTRFPTPEPTDFKPPNVETIRFEESGSAVLLSFDSETNLGNLPTYFSCDHLLTGASTFSLGENSFCTFLDRMTLLIVLGYDHSLNLGSFVVFKVKLDTGVIRDRFALRSRDDSSMGVQGAYQVRASVSTTEVGCMEEWSSWHSSGCTNSCHNVTRVRRCMRGFETEVQLCPSCRTSPTASISIVRYKMENDILVVVFSSTGLDDNVAVLILSDGSGSKPIHDYNQTDIEIGPFVQPNQNISVNTSTINFEIRSFRIQATKFVECDLDNIDLKTCTYPYEYIDLSSIPMPVSECPIGWLQMGTLTSNNHIAGSEWVDADISFEDCHLICDTNLECNSFNYGYFEGSSFCHRHRFRYPSASWDAGGTWWLFCARPVPIELTEDWCFDQNDLVKDMTGGYECNYLAIYLGCDFILPRGPLIEFCAFTCLCKDPPTTTPPSSWSTYPNMGAPDNTTLSPFRGDLDMCKEKCINIVNCNSFVYRLDVHAYCYLWKNGDETLLVDNTNMQSYFLSETHVAHGSTLFIISLSTVRMEEMFTVTLQASGLLGKQAWFRFTNDHPFIYEPNIQAEGSLGILTDGIQTLAAQCPNFQFKYLRVYVYDYVPCHEYGVPYIDCGHMFDYIDVVILDPFTDSPTINPTISPSITINTTQSIRGKQLSNFEQDSSESLLEWIIAPPSAFFCLIMSSISYWLYRKRNRKLQEIEDWKVSASTIRTVEESSPPIDRNDTWKPLSTRASVDSQGEKSDLNNTRRSIQFDSWSPKIRKENEEPEPTDGDLAQMIAQRATPRSIYETWRTPEGSSNDLETYVE